MTGFFRTSRSGSSSEPDRGGCQRAEAVAGEWAQKVFGGEALARGLWPAKERRISHAGPGGHGTHQSLSALRRDLSNSWASSTLFNTLALPFIS